MCIRIYAFAHTHTHTHTQTQTRSHTSVYTLQVLSRVHDKCIYTVYMCIYSCIYIYLYISIYVNTTGIWQVYIHCVYVYILIIRTWQYLPCVYRYMFVVCECVCVGGGVCVCVWVQVYIRLSHVYMMSVYTHVAITVTARQLMLNDSMKIESFIVYPHHIHSSNTLNFWKHWRQIRLHTD